MTTRARRSKCFFLCLYMKTIRAKRAKGHFPCFQCTTRPTWDSRKTFDMTQSTISMWHFRCRGRRRRKRKRNPVTDFDSRKSINNWKHCETKTYISPLNGHKCFTAKFKETHVLPLDFVAFYFMLHSTFHYPMTNKNSMTKQQRRNPDMFLQIGNHVLSR